MHLKCAKNEKNGFLVPEIFQKGGGGAGEVKSEDSLALCWFPAS